MALDDAGSDAGQLVPVARHQQNATNGVTQPFAGGSDRKADRGHHRERNDAGGNCRLHPHASGTRSHVHAKEAMDERKHEHPATAQ